MTKIPNGWHEVTVEVYGQLKQMNDSNPSFFTRQIEILSILTDTLSDDEIWSEMDIEDLTKKTHQITWLRTEPSSEYKREISDLKAVDIHNLTFGDFVDLEYYFTNNMYDNLPKILATIYRKYTYDEFGNIKLESLGSYDINERAIYFNTVPISWVYGVIYEFYLFKTNLFQTYKNLFQQGKEEEMDEDYVLTPEDIEAERMEKIAEKWGWENITHKLANGDITKYEEVLGFSVIFVFNQLSFLKEMKKS